MESLKTPDFWQHRRKIYYQAKLFLWIIYIISTLYIGYAGIVNNFAFKFVELFMYWQAICFIAYVIIIVVYKITAVIYDMFPRIQELWFSVKK